MLSSNKASIFLDKNPYISFSQFLSQHCEKEKNNKKNLKYFIERKKKYYPVGVTLIQYLFGKLLKKTKSYTHPDIRWLFCKPDGVCINNEFIVKMYFPELKKNLYTIPYHQWIDLQFQMEICNIDKVYLFNCSIDELTEEEYKKYGPKMDTVGTVSYDDKTYYWKLSRYAFHTIHRDKYWFELNFQKLTNNYSIYLKSLRNKTPRIYLTRSTVVLKNEEPQTDFLSISEVRNFCFKEPFLDWLKLYGKKYGYEKSQLSQGETFLLRQSSLFKDLIVENLSMSYPDDVVCLPLSVNYDKSLIQLTKKFILNFEPFIINAFMEDEENNTFVNNCILIRNDFIKDIFPENCIDDDIGKPSQLGKYHYRIFYPQFTSLKYNKKNNILNTDLINYTKTRLFLANKMLSKIQGNITNTSYIVGRNVIKTDEVINNCFDSVAIVNFNDIDAKYEEVANDALNWIKNVRQKGKHWKIGKHKHMLPNLSNQKDFGWRKVKKQIAHKHKDVTLLWNIGAKDRTNALEQGYSTWDQLPKSLSCFNLKDKTKDLVQNILKVNQSNDVKIIPKLVKNIKNWKQNDDVEFFVDFETTNNINDSFNKFPYIGGKTIIFNIGLGIKQNNKWKFKKFTVDRITLKEEKKIIDEWLSAMYKISSSAKVFHWGSAEKIFFKNAIKRHNAKWKEPNWFDLLEIFKKENIAIKHCFNFKLKDVANALYKHKFISSKWDDIFNGLDISAISWNAHLNAINKNISMKDDENVKKIEKYNEFDCKILYEILLFLRNYYKSKYIII